MVRLTGATNGSKTYSFTYNDEGIRTSKTKNGVTTTYYLNGSQIVGEETNGNITLYICDESGLQVTGLIIIGIEETKMESAQAIIARGILFGSWGEGGYVFAWEKCPDKKAIEESGAHFGVIISFTTTSSFEKDNAFSYDSHSYIYGPLRSVFPGPIKVTNVKIIRRIE